MNVPRTTTKDPTPPMGVDAHDVRSLHRVIRRHRRWSRIALALAVVALLIAVFAITKGP